MDVEPTTSTSGQLLSFETSANGTSIVKILIEISAHERLSIPLQKSELPGVPKSRSGPIQAYVYIYTNLLPFVSYVYRSKGANSGSNISLLSPLKRRC